MTEQSAESIFGQAIEIRSDDDRAAFLDEACGGDEQLRSEVEKLVEDHFRAGSFLEQPVINGDATAAMPTGMEQVGHHIGPYKLRERLGEGGMGVVWAAEQKQPLRRKVALKVIKPGMDSEQVIARFEAEREALALMDHPNIARVLDAGTTEQGRPYFVMELIRGVPITEYCDAHKLTIRERLELFKHVCKAVQHAHQKGIIHRDIKPSNVLVTEQDGTAVPKVIDFGVAKALHQPLTDRSIYTGVFQAIGTLAYMSPEQATLSASDVDTRADVYGLGVLLYELLTGTTPFDRKQLESAALDEACRIIREQDSPKPSSRLTTLEGKALGLASKCRGTNPANLGRTVRGDLDWIVMKALEKDRNRRYRTVDGVVDDLEKHFNHEAVGARPPSTWYRMSRFYRRNKALVGFGAIATCLLVMAVCGTTSGWYWAWVAERAAEHSKERAELESEERRKQLYISDMNAVQQLWLDNNVADVRARLNRHEIHGAGDLREFEWAYYRRELDQLEDCSQLIQLENQGTFASFSPDGTRLAIGQLGQATTGGMITLFDTDNWTVVESFGPKDTWVYTLSFSPNGNEVAYADIPTNRLVVRHLASGRESDFAEHDGYLKAVAYSPGGDIIASAGEDSVVLISDSHTGATIEALAVGEEGVAAIAFSPDGSHLAVSGKDGVLRIRDIATWNETDNFEAFPIEFGHSLTFSPDCTQLAFTNSTCDAVIRDLGTGEEAILRGHHDQVRSIAYSPNGRVIATGSRDGSVKLWDASTHAELRTLRGHTSFVQSIAFSPDGKELVSASRDYTARVWNLSKLLSVSNVVYPSGVVCDIVFAKPLDGFLSLTQDGIIELWDKESGHALQPPAVTGDDVLRMAISTSGTLAVVRETNVEFLNLNDGTSFTIDHGERLPTLNLDCTPAAFSHDERFFALAGTDGCIQVWDLTHGNARICFNDAHSGPAFCVAFAPDSLTLASGGRDGNIRQWDLVERRLFGEFIADRHRSEVACLAYSPDGTILASASFDNTVKLWDLSKTDAKPLTVTAHVGPVKTIVFSSSGRTLISASGDKTLRFFDVATGQTKAVFDEHRGAVCRLAWSDDQQVLASADTHMAEAIRFWRAK